MRNVWYPRQIAQYVAESQLKENPDVVVERDLTFGKEQKEKEIRVRARKTEYMDTVRVRTVRYVQSERSVESEPSEETGEPIRYVQSERSVESEPSVEPRKPIQYLELEGSRESEPSMETGKPMRYVGSEMRYVETGKPIKYVESEPSMETEKPMRSVEPDRSEETEGSVKTNLSVV